MKRFRTLIAAGALLLGVLVGTEAGLAQAPAVAVLVDPTPGCTDCSIRVSRSLVLESGPDGLGFSDAVLGYVAESAGFVVVDQVGFPGRFILLNPSGQFISTIGRPGDGPGEFLMAGRPVPSEGDSLFLYDVRRRAVSVFDPEGTFARRFSLPASPGLGMGSPAILRFNDGGMVMNASVRTVGGIGFPLHFLDEEGTLTKSFGSSPRSVTPQTQPTQGRVLAFASPSTFWAAHSNRYEIELWNREGSLLKSLRREEDWFPPLEEGETVRLIRPGIQGLFQDDDGLLWVVIRVPNPDGPPLSIPARERVSEGRSALPARTEGDRRFDTVIDVIDPETGTLVATRRLDQYVNSAAPPGVIFTYEERPTWEGRLVVWALELLR